MTEREDRQSEMMTTDGKTLKLRPVSQLLLQKISGAVERELREQGLPLDPPTYEIQTATGDIETHAHDEASLTTDAERAAWAKHLAAREKLGAEINARSMRVMLLRGMDAPEPPAEWVAEMAALGVDLPDDPLGRKFEYIQTELLKTPADIKGAIVKIMQLSMAGMAEADVAAVEGIFRRKVEGNAAQ